MVEFAAVLPVLLLLVLAIFEFGRVYNAQIIVTQAAREGARKGVITAVDADARAVTATKAFAQTLGADNVTVTVQRLAVAGDIKKAVVVTVSYDVQLVTPMVSGFFDGGKVTVGAVAQMREE